MTPEQEWRAHLLGEIKDVKKSLGRLESEMTTLKLKVALFSSIAGSIVSFIAQKIF